MHFVSDSPKLLSDMPENIYRTSKVKLNIREHDREMTIEKLRAQNKTQARVGMVTGDIFFTSLGHCCLNWGHADSSSCAFLSIAACEGKSPVGDPELPPVAAGNSVLCQGDVPTLAYLCNVHIHPHHVKV